MAETLKEGLWVERNGELVCVYEPQEHQKKFHASTAKYTIMEGGAGSGKSMAMRNEAYMLCLAIPRFTALILRRTMPELKMSHTDNVPFEAEKMGLAKDAWHSTDFVLRFPNGSKLKFGHCEDDSTVARYLSSEFDRIYFDELTTFTLRQFLFISSRARTTKKINGVPLRTYIRGGTNPVGPGTTWVRRYFITKDITPEENPGYNADDYEALHSTVDDNKYVDLKDYEKQLNQLPSDALRRAMRHGEWVMEGQFFSEWRETDPETGLPWHVTDRIPTHNGTSILDLPWVEVVEVVDWGYAEEGNPGMVNWWAKLPGNRAFSFMEYVFKKTLPEDVAIEIKRRRTMFNARVVYTVMDTQMWAEHEGPSVAELMAREGVSGIEADKQRETGWVNTHKWLREVVDSGVSRFPRLQWLKPRYPGDEFGCPVSIRTMPQMVIDPKNPSDMITTGVEDEAADTTRYFVMSRPSTSKEPQADPATQWIRNHIANKQARGSRLGSEATRRRAS